MLFILSSSIVAGAQEQGPDLAPGETAHVNVVYPIFTSQGYLDLGFMLDTDGITPAKYTGYFINQTTGASEYFSVTEPRLGKRLSVNTTDQYYIAISAVNANGTQVGYLEQPLTYPYYA